MLSPTPLTERPLWKASVWILRIAVCLQCVGLWRWLVGFNESPIFEWLFLPGDAGGLSWNEADALFAQQAIGWAALAFGLLTLVRPCAAFTAPVVFIQGLLIYAMWSTDHGFSPHGLWVSPAAKRLFPLLTQSCRFMTPLALLLIDPWFGRKRLSSLRIVTGEQLLRIGVALTFAGHGLEAIQHNFKFVDLLIVSTRNLTGMSLSESAAKELLLVIGVLDFVVALLSLTTHSRGVLLWAALWGGITALSRITAGGYDGFDNVWHQTLLRAPHCLAPLALAVFWHLLRTPRNPMKTHEELTA